MMGKYAGCIKIHETTLKYTAENPFDLSFLTYFYVNHDINRKKKRGAVFDFIPWEVVGVSYHFRGKAFDKTLQR